MGYCGKMNNKNNSKIAIFILVCAYAHIVFLYHTHYILLKTIGAKIEKYL
jgi:hypothetical protein